MLTFEQALASTDVYTIRREINAREDQIRFTRDCRQNAILHEEIVSLRQRAYQLISQYTRGRVSYMVMPALA